MTDTPEHDKLMAVKYQSQAVGEFLESCGYTLCRWVEAPVEIYVDDEWVSDDGLYREVGLSIYKLLADHYGIDLDKIEAEKRAMLDELRGKEK